MKKFPIAFAAAVSGFFLVYAAIYIGGILSALAIPNQYFSWFGKQHVTLALSILEMSTFALPIFFFSSAWTISTTLVLRRAHTITPLACLCGFVISWPIWSSYFGFSAQDIFSTSNNPLSILNSFAAPGGILFAAFLLNRFYPLKGQTL